MHEYVGIMFGVYEKHFYDYSIESCYFGHYSIPPTNIMSRYSDVVNNKEKRPVARSNIRYFLFNIYANGLSFIIIALADGLLPTIP